MADRLFEAMEGGSPKIGASCCCGSIRSPCARALEGHLGRVSELCPGREKTSFGDLGPMLAGEIRARSRNWGKKLVNPPRASAQPGLAPRNTPPGQRQHDLCWPMEVLPVRNVPVIAPTDAGHEEIDPAKWPRRSRRAAAPRSRRWRAPVAVFAPWRGSATFARLDAPLPRRRRGAGDGLAHGTHRAGRGRRCRRPDRIHCREELGLDYPITRSTGSNSKSSTTSISLRSSFLGRRAVVIKS